MASASASPLRAHVRDLDAAAERFVEARRLYVLAVAAAHRDWESAADNPDVTARLKAESDSTSHALAVARGELRELIGVTFDRENLSTWRHVVDTGRYVIQLTPYAEHDDFDGRQAQVEVIELAAVRNAS